MTSSFVNKSSSLGTENLPLTSIRGVAALWIVGHHWFSHVVWVQGFFGPAYAAVDIFFILSGLILTLVHSDLRISGSMMFFVKRALRIYPLHLLSLTFLILVVTWPQWTVGTLRSINWPEQLCSILLIHPFLNVTPMSNPPSWSIGVELVCYLAFPLAIWALRGIVSRVMAVALVILLLYGEYLILRTYLGDTHGIGAIAKGLGGFGLGMALGRLHVLHTRMSVGWSVILEGIGLVGALAALWSGSPTLIPVSAALMLFGLAYDKGLIAALLRYSTFVWLGRISFSVYLLHYPVTVAADRIIPIDLFPFGHTGPALRWAVLLIVLLALSTVTYHFIEMPGRRLIRIIYPRRYESMQSRLLISL